jgi:hypothetical protein
MWWRKRKEIKKEIPILDIKKIRYKKVKTKISFSILINGEIKEWAITTVHDLDKPITREEFKETYQKLRDNYFKKFLDNKKLPDDIYFGNFKWSMIKWAYMPVISLLDNEKKMIEVKDANKEVIEDFKKSWGDKDE